MNLMSSLVNLYDAWLDHLSFLNDIRNMSWSSMRLDTNHKTPHLKLVRNVSYTSVYKLILSQQRAVEFRCLACKKHS